MPQTPLEGSLEQRAEAAPKISSFFQILLAILLPVTFLVDFIYLSIYLFIFVFLPFLGPLPWHMEVLRLGVESEL